MSQLTQRVICRACCRTCQTLAGLAGPQKTLSALANTDQNGHLPGLPDQNQKLSRTFFFARPLVQALLRVAAARRGFGRNGPASPAR